MIYGSPVPHNTVESRPCPKCLAGIARRTAAVRVAALTVDAAAGYGWFDLQISRESFGPLPVQDQAMLQPKAAA
jgi:hypothetical protein